MFIDLIDLIFEHGIFFDERETPVNIINIFRMVLWSLRAIVKLGLNLLSQINYSFLLITIINEQTRNTIERNFEKLFVRRDTPGAVNQRPDGSQFIAPGIVSNARNIDASISIFDVPGNRKEAISSRLDFSV